MGYQDDFEDEAPHVHQRSHFDTERCPPPDAHAGLTMGELNAMGLNIDFTGKGDDGEPVRVSANGRAAFRIASAMDHALDRVGAASRAAGAPHSSSETLDFPGGVTEVRKPTREELATSAEQWITALREHMVDWNCYNRAAEGMVARLDAALKELAES